MKIMKICYDENKKIPLKYEGGFIGYSDKEL